MEGLLKQSTARSIVVLMIDSSDHVSGKTGLTLTITASKDGAAFASITPTVTELATGWYTLALTTGHTDTLGDLALHITGTGADPTDVKWQVVADLPGASVSSVTGAVGSVTAGVTVTTNDDKTGYSLSSAAVQAIWDALTSALTTTGSIGKRIVDYLTGDIYARLGAPSGASISADIATVSAVNIIRVSTAQAGGTSTITLDSSADSTHDDIYANLLVRIISGTGFGQARAVRSYVASTRVATVSRAWTVTPDNTSVFVLTPRESPWEEVADDHDASGTTGEALTASVSVDTGGITSGSFAAGAIDAAAIAADAIGSSELAASAANEIADALLARNIAGGSSAGRTVTDALRRLRNRVAIANDVATVYEEDDSTSAWTAAVTTTAGDPVSEIDPS